MASGIAARARERRAHLGSGDTARPLHPRIWEAVEAAVPGTAYETSRLGKRGRNKRRLQRRREEGDVAEPGAALPPTAAVGDLPLAGSTGWASAVTGSTADTRGMCGTQGCTYMVTNLHDTVFTGYCCGRCMKGEGAHGRRCTAPPRPPPPPPPMAITDGSNAIFDATHDDYTYYASNEETHPQNANLWRYRLACFCGTKYVTKWDKGGGPADEVKNAGWHKSGGSKTGNWTIDPYCPNCYDTPRSTPPPPVLEPAVQPPPRRHMLAVAAGLIAASVAPPSWSFS